MEKIRTLHPDKNKRGVNISKAKYDQVKAVILAVLGEEGELTYGELDGAVNKALDGKFEGSISWYCISVKLDMEARGIIERVADSKPQRIRLTGGSSV